MLGFIGIAIRALGSAGTAISVAKGIGAAVRAGKAGGTAMHMARQAGKAMLQNPQIITTLSEFLADRAERVSRAPVYDAQNALIEQTRQMDAILQHEKARRKAQISRFDELVAEQDIEEIRQFILEFGEYGLDAVERLFAKRETLADLVCRRYSIGDAECLKILELSEGPEKERRMKEFGDHVLAESIDLYFDHSAECCDLLFNLLDDAMNRNAKIKNAEIEEYTNNIRNFSYEKTEQERQKAEAQGRLRRLERLEKLFA